MTTKNRTKLNKQQRIDLFNPQLIGELESHYETSNKSWNIIAQELNLSPAVISTWRTRTYNGDIENINSMVRRYLKLQGLAPTVDLQYVPIKNNETILTVLETCRIDGVIGAIIGDTGTSKTTTLRNYAKNNPVIMISSNGTYRFPVEYLRRIHTHHLIGKDGRGTLNRLSVEIIDELKRKSCLIIVDQADYLSLRAIDIFRTFNDESGIGVVFVGLPSFLSKLKISNEPEIKQIRDRIRVKVELKPYKFSECEKILEKNFPGVNGQAKDFYDLSMGSLRVLSSLVYNVKKMVSRGAEIERDTILKAASMLERRAVE